MNTYSEKSITIGFMFTLVAFFGLAEYYSNWCERLAKCLHPTPLLISSKKFWYLWIDTVVVKCWNF